MKIARVMDANNQIVWASMQDNGQLRRIQGAPLIDPLSQTEEVVQVKRWLCPVEPRTIICIGLNYARHAAEGGHALPKAPVVFMKNPSAAIGHGETIRIPSVCGNEVDYECELVVVIGKRCCNVTENQALDYVFGYTAGNDVSARLWQAPELGGSQWCRAKGFDTFAPMGPVLVTAEEIPDPNCLNIVTELNGQIVQQSNTNDMIFPVRKLISFLSQDTSLLPGTVIMTGTPEGVGWARKPKLTLQPGDTVTVEIEKIGRLENNVK